MNLLEVRVVLYVLSAALLTFSFVVSPTIIGGIAMFLMVLVVILQVTSLKRGT